MLVVETIAKIRRAYFVQKKPIKAIRAGLRNLGFDGHFSNPNAGSNSNPGRTPGTSNLGEPGVGRAGWYRLNFSTAVAGALCLLGRYDT
jgi:hypothetical protein